MRPTGSNADQWHLFLSEHLDSRAPSPHGLTFMAVQIAEALDDFRAAARAEALRHVKAATNLAEAEARLEHLVKGNN